MLKNPNGEPSSTPVANKQVVPAGYEDLIAEFDNIDKAADFLANRKFDNVLELISTNESLLDVVKQTENNNLITELYNFNPKKFTERYINTLYDLGRLIGSPQEITETGRKLPEVPAAVPELRTKLIESLCTNAEFFKKVMSASNPKNPADSLIQAKIKFPDYAALFERTYAEFYAHDVSPKNQPNYVPRP